MARFYGTMQGSGSKTNTKMGTTSIRSHVRSWDHGIIVEYKSIDKDNSICEVWLTGGSNNPEKKKLIKSYKVKGTPNTRPGRDRYDSPIGGY